MIPPPADRARQAQRSHTLETLPEGSEPELALFLPQLSGGGAERIIVLIANHAARRGLKVDLVLNRVAGPYLCDVDEAVTLVSLDAQRVWDVLPRLIVYLRRRKPRRLLSTLYRQNFLVSMAHAIAGSSARLVLREANTFSRDSGQRREAAKPLERIKGLVDQQLLPMLYRRADQVIAISEGVREDLLTSFGLPPELVVAIHNPIDLAMIDARAGEPVEHRFWDEPREDPLIVSVGRLEAQKDFETLIHGFAQARKVRSMRLLILGTGSQRARLTALVEGLGIGQDVCMPGFVHNPFAVLARADLFALTSRWEGFGNVFIEALAMGLPVVATDCPSGPAEILEGGRYGTLIPIGDRDALARALLETLEHRPEPRRQRARAEAFGLEHILPAYGQALMLEL
jgi:glycosyltransferase involved in cell wall biosynthesis